MCLYDVNEVFEVSWITSDPVEVVGDERAHQTSRDVGDQLPESRSVNT
jgi:hypothetical protein